MNWYRKYPLFAGGLTLCGLVFLGEAALIYERYTATRDAAKRLEQRKVELEGMSQLTPPPTREVATAIEADLAKAQKSLAAMQAELTGKGATADRIRDAKPPAARTDAFFDLATFVERTRELAEKNGVEVRPEAARFGYSRYANEGPESDRIEPIFRQRLVAEYILGALLEAKPRALLSVKRAHTVTKAEREARAAALANGTPLDEIPMDSGSDSPDYFTIEPGVSAKVSGYVETTPFRLVFTGQTATLRNFLNRLASFELPVLVREVEVDLASIEESLVQNADDAPASGTAGEAAPQSPSVVLSTEPAPNKAAAGSAKAPLSAKTPPPAKAPATPIVPKSLSKYTVTVEFIELVPVSAAPAETPATPSS